MKFIIGIAVGALAYATFTGDVTISDYQMMFGMVTDTVTNGIDVLSSYTK